MARKKVRKDAEKKYEKYIFPLVYMPGAVSQDPKKTGRGLPFGVNRNDWELATHHIEVFTITQPGTSYIPGAKGKGSMAPMYHVRDEMFLFIGTNPDDVTDLGGEIELWLGLGEEAEKYIITKPSLVLMPAGTVHCPMVFRKVERPIKEIIFYEGPTLDQHQIDLWPKDYKP